MCSIIVAKYDELIIKRKLEDAGFKYVENLKCYQTRSDNVTEYCSNIVELKINRHGSASIFIDDVTSEWCVEKANEAMKIMKKGKYVEFNDREDTLAESCKMKRKTMLDDMIKHIETVKEHSNILKDSKDIIHVMYGKADYGYFVDICSKNPDEVAGMGIITDTKAGARYLAKRYQELLNIPIESDWD